MKHLAAYLMLVVGGNSNPTAEDVTNALSQCGIEVDSERLGELIAELDGKDLNELMTLGKEKLVAGGGATEMEISFKFYFIIIIIKDLMKNRIGGYTIGFLFVIKETRINLLLMKN